MSISTTSRDLKPRIGRATRAVTTVEASVTDAVRPVTLPALRILLGIVFVWFGALKVLDLSPVAAIVSGTLPWADPRATLVVLGAAEVTFGVALVTGYALRLVLPLMAAHLAGTFLTFVMLPQLMFRHDDPLLLTESGEFVAKNLVLIAATVVLLCHTQSGRRPARATAPG
jgi:putative oxidoreductase